MFSRVSGLGRSVLFLSEVGGAFRREGLAFRLFLDQAFSVGVRSLPTIFLTGIFVGGIMAIQIDLQLRDFGAESFLGGLTASVTWRNVGPVLIAFILSGKVGAQTSAELSAMKATDQVDALRCLGINPLTFLILPRLLAASLSSFLLLIVGLFVSVGSSLAFSNFLFGIDTARFLRTIPDIVSTGSVFLGVIKSLVFGFLIGWISCYRGYTAGEGSRGVGDSVRSTAVETMVFIILTNSFLSWIFI